MDNRFRYDGKRALVVGCYSGMGAATAKIVQSLGGEVFGVDYKEPDYDLAGFTNCDLRNESQIDAALVNGLERADPPRLLLRRAPADPPAARRDEGELLGDARGRRGRPSADPEGGAVADHLLERGPAVHGAHGADQRAAGHRQLRRRARLVREHMDIVAEGYAFSKEAIIVYTMKRALEVVGEGVRVNCISPGPTATPMMPEFEKAAGAELIDAFVGPMNRQAQPEEMGWPLAFLNSDAASFITGLNLLVDAGFVAGVTTGAIDVAALFAAGMAARAKREG